MNLIRRFRAWITPEPREGIVVPLTQNVMALCEKSGLTPEQLIVRGFCTFDLITDLYEEGAKIIVRHSDGSEDEVDFLQLDRAD